VHDVRTERSRKSLRKIAGSLDAEKLNLGVSIFIAVKTNQHNAEWVQRFRKIVVSFPEVVDFYRLSGDVDYLIRAAVSDIRAYDDLYSQSYSEWRDLRKIIRGEQRSTLLSYFRHQTDKGLPRDRSDFCRSLGLALQCVIVIDWHASMTGRGIFKSILTTRLIARR
jgi:DNA-binding Lrp family transcriptional regulator